MTMYEQQFGPIRRPGVEEPLYPPDDITSTLGEEEGDDGDDNNGDGESDASDA